MNQKEAIQKVGLILKEDPAVRAVFLKGSHGRGEQDNYSDIDMYCLVHSDKMDGFLSRRIDYLESYKPLICIQ